MLDFEDIDEHWGVLIGNDVCGERRSTHRQCLLYPTRAFHGVANSGQRQAYRFLTRYDDDACEQRAQHRQEARIAQRLWACTSLR